MAKQKSKKQGNLIIQEKITTANIIIFVKQMEYYMKASSIKAE